MPAAATLLIACSTPRAESRPTASAITAVLDSARPWRRPGDRIDSVLPMPEYLRRFRAGLAEPAGFTGGAPSRAALAQRAVEALGRRDTGALATLLITRAEFAWLVFPSHRSAQPPYELDPALFWFQIQRATAQGLGRILGDYGGRGLQFRELWCQPDSLQFVGEGPVRGWSACRVHVTTPNGALTRQVFGTILERGGQFKLLSYAISD
ncbi:MAG: hypothetical protein ACT4PM_03610 [Gemmatimonadales bacterium]